jgi:elongation factor G
MDQRRTIALIASIGAQTDGVCTALTNLGAREQTSSVGPWRLTSFFVAKHTLTLLEFPAVDQFDDTWLDALFAVDALVLVTSADHGIDPHTAQVWHAAQELRLPTIITLIDLEHGRVDIDEMAHIARRIFDEPDAIHVIAQPAFDDNEAIGGVIDVITLTVFEPSEQSMAERPCDPEHVSLLADSREELIFHIAARSDDTKLVEQVGAGMTPMPGALHAAAMDCVRSGDLVPVVPVELTPPYVGAAGLATLLIEGTPPPTSRLPVITPVPPRTSAPDEPSATDDLCAQVITQEANQALVRIWTGTLNDHGRAGDLVALSGDWPAGTVLAEPSGSLHVERPAV